MESEKSAQSRVSGDRTSPPGGPPGNSAPGQVLRAPRRSFTSYLVWSLLGALVLIALYTLFMLWWSYSEGERAGVLQKFSKRGWICKTYEGELAMYVVGGIAPQIWNFSVRDETTAAELTKAVGRQVRLHYTEHPGLPTNCFARDGLLRRTRRDRRAAADAGVAGRRRRRAGAGRRHGTGDTHLRRLSRPRRRPPAGQRRSCPRLRVSPRQSHAGYDASASTTARRLSPRPNGASDRRAGPRPALRWSTRSRPPRRRRARTIRPAAR